MTDPLTVSQAVTIGAVCDAASRTVHCVRLLENGDLLGGTVRCIGDEQGNRLNVDEDIRDGYLRVTTDMGWEVFWPMREVIPMVIAGTLVLDYRVAP